MTMMNRIRVGIFGGSGYGGSELLRILLPHPNAEIAFVTANEHAGKPVSEVHRSLHGLTDLRLSKVPEDLENLADLDCAFLALPHGQAMDIAPRLPASVKAIDLSGDFRLRDKAEFEQHYNREHTRWTLRRSCLRPHGKIGSDKMLADSNPMFRHGNSAGPAPLAAGNLIEGRVVWTLKQALRAPALKRGEYASSSTNEFLLRL